MTNTRHRLTALALAVLLLAPAVGIAAAAPPDSNAEQAVLNIEQPHYVDSAVQTDSSTNATTYIVDGSVQEIQLQNINDSAVVDYGVAQESASLNYDPTTSEYTLDSNGENGTYQLHWVVAEQITVGGNNSSQSRIVKQRYEANVQIRSASFAHVSQSNYEALRADAENWTSFMATIDPIAPGPPEQQLTDVVRSYRFLREPLAALSGDFTATVIMLTFYNGGRLALGLLLVVPLAAVAPILIKYRRLKQRLPDVDTVDQQKREIWKQKRQQRLAEVTPHDLPLGGRTADKIAETFGTNLKQVINNVFGILAWSDVKRFYLQAMHAAGYRVEYDEAPDGTITNATLIEPGQAGSLPQTDGGTSALAQPSRELVDAIADDEINPRVLRRDVALADVDAPITATDVDDDLVANANVDIPEDFESRERFAECLGEVFKAVAAHDYTTEDGTIKQDRSVLNTLHVLATVTNERFDIPSTRYYRDMFFWLGENISVDAEVDEAASNTGYGDLLSEVSEDAD